MIVITSVWLIAEGKKKVPDGPENMRPQNSQSAFPGKHHMTIREQEPKWGRALPSPIISKCKGPEVGRLKRLEKSNSQN